MHKAKKYLDNFRFSVKLICKASQSTFIIKSLLSFMLALIPYASLIAWREMINVLTERDELAVGHVTKSVMLFLVIYCLMMVMQKLLESVSEYFTFIYEEKINFFLDNKMVDKISEVDMEFFDTSSLKDISRNSWGHIYVVKRVVTFAFDVIQGGIKIFVSATLLLTLSPMLAPVILLICIPSVIFDRLSNSEEYQFEKTNAGLERRKEYLSEIFSGGSRPEIRVYRLKHFFLDRYKEVWYRLERAYRTKEKKVALLGLFSAIVMIANETVIYVFAILKLIAGKIGMGDVAYYVSLVEQFSNDVMNVTNRFNEFDLNSRELSDVRELLEMKPLLDKNGSLIPKSNPCIEFCDVSFHYPNSEKNVLEHCSFKINADDCIGLVGVNGSGKSTLVKLLCRFYDPSEGKVLLDGVDYREYDINALRALFGVLFQEAIRYSLTLRDNIALSDIERIGDDAGIMKACSKSKVKEIMESWEKGLEENLTKSFDPEGKELSGGQWQRVALARTFFKDANIVFLDEPSAALDPMAEHEIFQDFKSVSKGRISLLISHRLSNIIMTRKILVLENGRIIEQGSHEQLMAANGRYAQLYNLQAEKYL